MFVEIVEDIEQRPEEEADHGGSQEGPLLC